MAFAEEVLSWLQGLESVFALSIERVGIDAPSDFCRDVSGRRAAERCLDAKGISCFATPSEAEFARKIEQCRRYLESGGAPSGLPNANQIWMLVGFQLFRTLSQHYECIETYPQAIIRQLACDSGHKSTASGLQCQLAEAAAILGISAVEFRKKLDQAVYGSPHDRLDAFFTAWVASLADHERVGFGTPPGDVIWAPLARAEGSA